MAACARGEQKQEIVAVTSGAGGQGVAKSRRGHVALCETMISINLWIQAEIQSVS